MSFSNFLLQLLNAVFTKTPHDFTIALLGYFLSCVFFASIARASFELKLMETDLIVSITSVEKLFIRGAKVPCKVLFRWLFPSYRYFQHTRGALYPSIKWTFEMLVSLVFPIIFILSFINYLLTALSGAKLDVDFVTNMFWLILYAGSLIYCWNYGAKLINAITNFHES